MGHKIFISYKYNDNNVQQITNNWQPDTARNYVDKLEDYFTNNTDDVYKGEPDGEDLSSLTEDSIWEKLKDRIYDSTLTIVLISPNMKESYLPDRQQWIPWEISYSLKEESRKNKSGNMVKSSTNAVLAIVLPDRYNSYSYFIQDNICCNSTCRTLQTNTLFEILKKNMFNIKKPNNEYCDNSRLIYHGECSYITSVKWVDFILDPYKYIENAYTIQNSIEQYDVYKEID